MIIHPLLTDEDTGVQRAEMICLTPWLESGRTRSHDVCLTSSAPHFKGLEQRHGVSILALPPLLEPHVLIHPLLATRRTN